MDIPHAYDNDLCITRLLNNSDDDDDDDETYALELQLQEAMIYSFSNFTIIQLGNSSSSEPSKKSLCEICAEIRDNTKMFTIQECTHCYCKHCISKHVSIELQKRRIVITCPGVGCTSVLETGTCGDIVTADVRRLWSEELIAREERERRGMVMMREKEDLVFHDLAKEKAWRRCPNCLFYVDKMDGCLHITCRCGFQFCYACGKPCSSTHGGCHSSFPSPQRAQL